MKIYHPLLLLPMAVGCTTGAAPAPAPSTRTPLVLEEIPEWRRFPDCDADAPDRAPCRLPTAPILAEAEARLGTGPAAAWSSGERWFVAYRADTASTSGVRLMGGVQLPMSRYAGHPVWALGLRIPDVRRAVISLAFLLMGEAGPVMDDTSLDVWRGPEAPREPKLPHEPAGTLFTDSIESAALGTRREITVYLPPGQAGRAGLPVVYMADGAAVRDYGPILDAHVSTGRVPPVALVGVTPSRGRLRPDASPGPANDLRAIEYLEGIAALAGSDSAEVAARYERHERFFVEEVRAWAEERLPISAEASHRAVHGSSNGGAFALALGRKYPHLYDLVIANSTGSAGRNTVPPVGGWERAPRHRLSVGSLEVPRLRKALAALADSLGAHGVPHRLDVYPSGHDYRVWVESLPAALAWWREGAR